MIHSLRVIREAFVLQWKSSLTVSDISYPLVGQASTIISVGWITREATTGHLIMAIAWGSFMTALWRSAAFRGGWIMSQAHQSGALEMELATRARLSELIFGRLAAIIVLYGLLALTALAIVLLLNKSSAQICQPLALLVSIGIGIISITSYVYFLIPVSFLTGGLPGFFNAILPGIVILSGFLQPPSLLPGPVQWLSEGLATTWAMKAITQSVQPGCDLASLLKVWSISLAITLVVFGVAKWFIDVAEEQLRRGRYASFLER